MIIVNLFIFWYILLMVFYDHYIASSKNPMKLFIFNKFLNYPAFYLGLGHSWTMFCSPFKYSYNIYARLEYTDGSKNHVKILDSEKREFLYRKTNVYFEKLGENILAETIDYGIRYAFCFYISHKYRKKDTKVERIVLIRETIGIPDFDSGAVGERKVEDYYIRAFKV